VHFWRQSELAPGFLGTCNPLFAPFPYTVSSVRVSKVPTSARIPNDTRVSMDPASDRVPNHPRS